MKEFTLIDTFFKEKGYQRKDVMLGIGDDCALTQVPQGQWLATTTDTLVEGVHFLPDSPARAVAHKAMAVNLSDLAAMGADPCWINLSLSLPNADEAWLGEFSAGLRELCEYYSVQLIGGDTVRGPLSITITAQGFVPENQALTRKGARPGDFVFVTGTLGDAGLGLDLLLGKANLSGKDRQFAIDRHRFPTPRVSTGAMLRRIAHACIDISDGLLADLGHILKQSHCGATLDLDKLPLSAAMQSLNDREKALEYALSAGDDYELLFTVSEEQKGNLDTVLANYNLKATCIGQLNGQAGKLDLRLHGEAYSFQGQGYQHF